MNWEIDLLKALTEWLISQGLSDETASYLSLIIGLCILTLIVVLVDLLARRLLLRWLNVLTKKSRTKWDDLLAEHKFFRNLAHVFPVLLFQLAAPALFFNFEETGKIVLRLTNALLVVLALMVLNSLLDAIATYFRRSPLFREKPIDSYFQLTKLVMSIIGGLLILSILLAKSPLFFLSAFGAMTAVIVLIFKDTLLGFVASIYLSVNDMVRVGDWVEMPKYEADGDVTQITLTTVKVRNFDKTITTIPTYAFLSDSFKNWRGMKEAGGRRIKRSIYVNISSIRFCTPEMLDRFERFELVQDYIKSRREEIERYNAERGVDTSVVINGRNMTNAGIFRKYAEFYLQHNPHILQAPNMILMVRQLEPSEKGLPIQIYAFTKDTRWVNYENIQADIFDHLLAAAAAFGLEVFQNPSGSDFAKLIHTATPHA